MSGMRDLQRTLYLMQRTIGDVDAAQRGRLGKRLSRRYLTRWLFRVFR